MEKILWKKYFKPVWNCEEEEDAGDTDQNKGDFKFTFPAVVFCQRFLQLLSLFDTLLIVEDDDDVGRYGQTGTNKQSDCGCPA